MTQRSATHPTAVPVGQVAVVGAGRLGSVLIRALNEAGISTSGPHGHGYSGASNGFLDDVVILCVPDAAIADAASCVQTGPLVAHCSGATGLGSLAPHRGFSIHPLMTFTPDSPTSLLSGVGAAIDGTDVAAQQMARMVAERLGLRPFVIEESDRATYHAATAIAANFLVTLESVAGSLMGTIGADPSLLLPLARAALENWGRLGAGALTGPVARGDQPTVDAHRAAIAERAPDYLAVFDAMVNTTRILIEHPESASTAELGLSARTSA